MKFEPKSSRLTKGEFCYRLRVEEGLSWRAVAARASQELGGAVSHGCACVGARTWALKTGAEWPAVPRAGGRAPRRCAYDPCGGLFVPGTRGTQKYCGRTCLVRHTRARRPRRSPAAPASRRCARESCGASFLAVRRTHRYCSYICQRRDSDGEAVTPREVVAETKASILAPAHCGWCGVGLEAGRRYCRQAHRRLHEEGLAELEKRLDKATPASPADRLSLELRRASA